MHEEVCTCIHCKYDKDFDLPEELIEDFVKGKVVIFAGAGISTESKTVYPSTLYDEIGALLDIDPNEYQNISFPEMMSKLVEKEGQRELRVMIKKRLDYVDAFTELRWAATRFHREIATIPHVREIITTNWDTFFEDEAGATPIVTGDDYSFWDLPGRKVFKIHGSITNVGSIIATEDDYKKCYKELKAGVIGSTLRHILATKTVVFIGYSFRDDDFKKIYNFVKKDLGSVIPKSYVVTTSKDFQGVAKNSTILHTGGRYFIQKVKEALVKKEAMLPDERFLDIADLADRVASAHSMIIDFDSYEEYPELVYTSAYQDGLIHATQRILAQFKTGEYSDEHHIAHVLHSYMYLQKQAIKSKKYFDASYIEGYINGIMSLVLDAPIQECPIYYLYGYKEDIESFKELKLLLNTNKTPKVAYTKAARMMKRMPGLQPSHTPFLAGILDQ